MEKTILIDAGR